MLSIRSTLPVSHPPPLSGPSLGNRCSSIELSLLHHFENDYYHREKSLHPGLNDLMGVFFKAAFATPYLMDELLAYAAAHKSTLNPGKSQVLFYEATKLQTRALGLYNGATRKCTSLEISKETCLPMFIFSSLMSHHAIFNLSHSAHRGLDAALEELTRSVVIHRGLIAIAKASWPMFTEQTRQRFISSCQRDHMPISSSPGSRRECDTLLRRVGSAFMPSNSTTALRSAVENLQDQFDSISTNDTHSMWAAVQDWLVTVPAGYMKLLDQRQPEALVVLAHFGVLLHRVAEHWFVGDLGTRLIRLIDSHLGPSWAEWLEWPNRTIRARP